ncbi:MAG: histidine ammonia-lyase [Alphaproteobacteria bacterium]|nr:histidine ammonia-lyase [Alphaproteobacteria bacterium]
MQIQINRDPDYVRHIRSGTAFLDRLLEEDGVIYGVTTGYGDSCTVDIPRDLVEELPLHLLRFHGCGMGAYLPHDMARAVMLVRLVSLTKGYSGVSWELLERLETFLNADVVPLIPEEGSVGASGDLTPLSYVAALLVGERDAVYRDETCPAVDIHRQLGLTPLKLRPKEGLALMNGTAVMTALACDAYARAEYLTRLCTRLTALASVALAGNRYHFDERLFELKPHPGQAKIAGWLRQDLDVGDPPRNSDRLQDRYSIRCAPHVVGVLRDSLPWMRGFIETELNSTNDNPVIDGAGERVLHGGHFYGGHIAFVMDGMKNCVANLADLMDRQLALLVDNKFNNGLPANLSGATVERSAINHGFKAVQIAVSAWTAEALKQTMPASVFSRSTECHNQDKVSMGTIAARDCLRVLELTEQVAAAHMLATVQAVALRQRSGTESDSTEPRNTSEELAQFSESVLTDFALLEEDRPLEADLRRFADSIRNRRWALYE